MESLLYENPLGKQEDIKDFILEGEARMDFSEGALCMENALEAEWGQKANYVLWCPRDFPAHIRISWEFKPLTDRGLCILFFSAAGRGGEDLFHENLKKRTGEYPQYHSGDINAFHVSYFRRKEADERAFHTCNLRKSHGFHLVAQGADPLPGPEDVSDFYRVAVEKRAEGNRENITFSINDLTIFTYVEDGKSYGAPLGRGKIGFRQLASLLALYRNLQVWSL